MAIKVKARVLLELGSELISSDPIAIYELVKNSLDARASRIQVVVHVVLQRSDHLRIAETMQRHLKKEKVALPRETLRELLEGAFDSAASPEMRDAYVEAVTTPSSADRPTALIEAYRARNWIEVRDDGLGMSLDDLENLYLTVGTPNRLLQRSSDPSHATAPRRFVWNPTVRIDGRRRARWACGQAAFEPVHMSTGRLPGARF